MDKSCLSTGDYTNPSNNSGSGTKINKDQSLKHLNKLSHKISKRINTNKPTFHQLQQQSQLQLQPQPQPQTTQQHHQNLHAQQHQPPVYNINKDDFRDVVQKLTGSPAHERISTPPPIQTPKPPSTRLQGIRPPPLAHVSNRPPPLLNSAVPPPCLNHVVPGASSFAGAFIHRPTAPPSPLLPFQEVHGSAKSPISAYMRYLQSSNSTVDSNKQFAGLSPLAPLVSPRWNNLGPPPPPPPPQQQSQQDLAPPHSSGMGQSHTPLQLSTPPLPFGCLNSPRFQYPLLSPSMLLSPSSFPLSPTLLVLSPTWRGL